MKNMLLDLSRVRICVFLPLTFVLRSYLRAENICKTDLQKDGAEGGRSYHQCQRYFMRYDDGGGVCPCYQRAAKGDSHPGTARQAAMERQVWLSAIICLLRDHFRFASYT